MGNIHKTGRKNRKRIQQGTFLVALAIGLIAGVLIGFSNKHEAKLLPEFQGVLVGVDSLESTAPVLESIWFFSYLPKTNTLNLSPLYPESNFSQESSAALFRMPHEPILLPDIASAENYALPFLTENLSNLDYVLVIDNIGFSVLLNRLSTAAGKGNNTMLPYFVALNPPQTYLDPQAAFAYQRKLLEILCETPDPLLNIALASTWHEIEAHVQSNVPVSVWLDLQNSFSESTNTPICHFEFQDH